MKNLSAERVIENPSLQLFITGGAGIRKVSPDQNNGMHQQLKLSVTVHLILSQRLIVLLLAPTGVAAVNINGTTIHCSIRNP